MLRKGEDVGDREVRDVMNRERAKRRAAKRIRLYTVHSRLGNLNTLTYRCVECQGDPCTCGLKAAPERDEAVHQWQKFRKRLRRHCGAIPYLGVIEYGERTGRIHHHVLTRERFSQADLEDLWGQGHVEPGNRDEETLSEPELRAAAGYCSTYAGKALDAGHGRQAYFVAQGFAPPRAAGWARSVAEALDMLALSLGGFDTISHSDEWEGYDGPASLTVRLG